MKRSYWVSIIIGVLASIFIWLWFSGAIHNQWLKHAVEHGNWDRVIKLVRSGVNPNIYINSKDSSHDTFVWSPLTAALSATQYDVVKDLLKHGASPDLIGPFGATAIYIPVRKHDAQMVELLFAYGANPEASDRMNSRPLWLSLRDEELDILTLFVKAGAQITQKEHGRYVWDTEYDRIHNPAKYEYLKNAVEKLEPK